MVLAHLEFHLLSLKNQNKQNIVSVWRQISTKFYSSRLIFYLAEKLDVKVNIY